MIYVLNKSAISMQFIVQFAVSFAYLFLPEKFIYLCMIRLIMALHIKS